MEEIIKIPKERMSVFIGEKGVTKRRLQSRTKTKIEVKEEGEIIIKGEDNLGVYLTTNIVKAIARGFNPETALLLLNEKYMFELLDITEYMGKTDKALRRIRARIIGTNGKARMYLEKITNTHISVYGKTVGIIGPIEDVEIARRGVEKILNGAPHGKTYQYIENQKQLAFAK